MRKDLYHLCITEALCEFGLEDFLQRSLGQLVTAVTAPDEHFDQGVGLRAGAGCPRAARAQTARGQRADLKHTHHFFFIDHDMWTYLTHSNNIFFF